MANGADEALRALDRHGGVARRRALALELDNLVATVRRAVARGDGLAAVGPGFLDHSLIRVTEGDEIGAPREQPPHHAASLPAAADHRKVQLAVGGGRAGLGARQDQRPAERRRPQRRR